MIGSSEFGLEATYRDIFTNGYNSKELMFTRHLKSVPTIIALGSLLKLFGGGTYKPVSCFLRY